MKDIPLNDYAIELLNEGLWFIKEENYRNLRLQCEKDKDKADWWTGDEYFEEVYSKGREHDGFPASVYAYSMSQNNIRFVDGTATCVADIMKKKDAFLKKLQTTFNLKRNALFAIYPPGGYISWHNNANASAYNFIFTWSETGDGYWRHWDNEKKEMVTIPDVKGWQCKAGYFGAYSDPPSQLLYHSARTNCLRMTVAFILDRSDMSLGLQDWIIEDIHA